jgi:small redox-active disulfide protein 2
MLSIKVLGPGCANCVNVQKAAETAVANLGVEATIIKVTEVDEIMRYPILATPGLVINEKLVAAGRIPNPREIMTWLSNAAEVA